MLFLIAPLVLRSLSYEPYPAILLPDGSGTTPVINNEIVFSFDEVYAQDNRQQWVKVNTTDLFDPMPDPYTGSIIRSLVTDGKSSITEGSKKHKILKYLNPSRKIAVDKEDIKEMHTWLKKKLIVQQLDTIKINISRVTIYTSPQSGKLIRKTIDDKKIILLN